MGTDELPKSEVISFLQRNADAAFLRKWKLTGVPKSIRKNRNCSQLVAAYKVWHLKTSRGDGKNKPNLICIVLHLQFMSHEIVNSLNASKLIRGHRSVSGTKIFAKFSMSLQLVYVTLASTPLRSISTMVVDSSDEFTCTKQFRLDSKEKNYYYDLMYNFFGSIETDSVPNEF